MEMKESRNGLQNFLFILLGSFLTIFIIYGLRSFVVSQVNIENNNGVCYTTCEDKVTITENGISSAVDKIYDAVVLIENYKNGNLYSTGTGFVYKVDEKYGYLLTNYHVVEGSTTLSVVLSTKEEVNATYIGGDSYLDIAILTIPKDKVLKVAELGSSETSKLGDTVFTIGTPIGSEYIGTVTRGILSGKDRLVNVSNNNDNIVMKVLQTDAAINPGNSGGPLVNINGEVIGINSIKLVEDEIEGMGFAIAIEDVKNHLVTLENKEQIKRPYLGVSMINVTDKMSLMMAGISVDSKIKNGVVVASVLEDSSVANVLQKGDVVTKLNGEEVENAAYFKYELYKYEIGEEITITFIRENNVKTEKIILKG